MDINILSYNYVSELQTEIQSIINNFSGSQNNLKFVVPSRKDKNWFFREYFEFMDMGRNL